MPAEHAKTFELASGLVWRRWGDETVVYVEHNFKTHLLNAVAGLVLETLSSAAVPCTNSQILDLLMAEDSDEGVSGDEREHDAGCLQAVLEQLLQHEVVRSC